MTGVLKSIQLSVIIPTLGRKDVLWDTLNDLRAQEFENWECLVVMQDAIDTSRFSALVTEAHWQLRLFRCSEPNASLARNIGLQEARGKVALFLDDDLQIKNPKFLELHWRNYKDPYLSGVFGQVLGPNRVVRQKRHWLSYRERTGWLYFPANYSEPAMVSSGGAGNLSVRRDWAISVGGMDAQFEKGAHREESDFCLRYTAQYGQLVFDPQASVVHLGAAEGGCRNWGPNRGVHPLHHASGEWYFILKNLRAKRIYWRDLPHHLLQLWLRQIWNSENRWNPRNVGFALARCFEGFRKAREALSKGPEHLSPDLSKKYTEVK